MHSWLSTRMMAAAIALAMPTCAAWAQDNDGCSSATLSGSFGFTLTGTIGVPSSPQLFADVGTQTFDGKSNTDVISTVSVNGTLYKSTLTGTYVVNQDCTGSFTLSGSSVPLSGTGGVVNIPPTHHYFVIVGGGAEFDFIPENSGSVRIGVGKKQFPSSQESRTD
jgi:hypothetical protein